MDCMQLTLIIMKVTLSFTSSMCFFLFSSAWFNFDSNFCKSRHVEWMILRHFMFLTSFICSDFSAIFFSFISWAFEILPSLAVSFCNLENKVIFYLNKNQQLTFPVPKIAFFPRLLAASSWWSPGCWWLARWVVILWILANKKKS